MRNYMLCAMRSVLFLFLVINLIGCEAFVRKFTRKPKDGDRKDEIVMSPQEYANLLSREEQYRQYFMYWKAWQDELLTAMDVVAEQVNTKKLVDSASEALKNLVSMRELLNADYQKKLDLYINRAIDLRDGLNSYDQGGAYASVSRQEARKLRRDIMQNFSFPDIKKGLM